MASARRQPDKPRRGRKAQTPEAREQQITAQAVDLAERQIQDGTASAQVLSHYLKQSTQRERLELERLRNENNLLEAKVLQASQGNRMEELYEGAIKAMKRYTGDDDEDDEYDD